MSDVFWVLTASTSMGAIGGMAASLRSGKTSPFDMVNHALNMGCFGASVSMVGLWWLEPDRMVQMLLIGLSGICGLIGLPIFEPVANAAIRWVRHIIGCGGIDDEN